MIEINLVPDVKQELIRARRVRSTVVSGAILTSIAAVAIVVLLAVYVFGVQTVRHAVADEAIKKNGAELASVEDLSKMLTIQNQLTKMSALNDEKMINSRLFDVLAAIIPPAPNDIQISNLSINTETGTIDLEGQAPSGFPALETFKKTISVAHVRHNDEAGDQVDLPLASDISTSNISLGEDASGTKVLRFELSFTYAPELFAVQTTNPRIVLISEGNVTDSYLGIPKSIFVDRAQDTEETQ